MSEPKPAATDVALDEGAQLAEYHPVSRAAIVGLLLGLFAPLALVGPLLWIVPAVAVATCGMALRTIARSEGTFAGRKAALLGLSLALLFGSAAVANSLSYRWMLQHEAQSMAHRWFDLLRDKQPQKAHFLTVNPESRPPMDNSLWDFYRQAPRARQELKKFVDEPLVRAMLALGPKAEVHYWRTESVRFLREGVSVWQVYRISYEDDDGKHTFFAVLDLRRVSRPKDQAGRWYVASQGGFIRLNPPL